LFAHGRWFSPGTPASSTTQTVRHDIAEILLKVALKHKKSNQTKHIQDNGQTTGKLYHLWLRAECTFFGNLQSRARTHAVLVIGLYELL
jgi:hypothetical protein